ncbi:dihydrofolate reductase [Candidatus Endowatersipora endosymbiont of Watersipora subatra]|uniref:dihydrofolate reductase n=1 Tax=Candidatus Endowatersipora endosymbiont of Watersipora subatra TaxID=3077946 RepID=UPI00312C7960
MNIDIAIVAAVAKNGVIGANGSMPWRLSSDLKVFKQLTIGKPMIMGRKTFESINSILPGRTTLVVTRNTRWYYKGVLTVTSLEKAIETAKSIAKRTGRNSISIAGGGDIYHQAMEYANILYLTKVDAEPVGDTMFPHMDKEIWREVSYQALPKSNLDTAGTEHCVYQRC